MVPLSSGSNPTRRHAWHLPQLLIFASRNFLHTLSMDSTLLLPSSRRNLHLDNLHAGVQIVFDREPIVVPHLVESDPILGILPHKAIDEVPRLRRDVVRKDQRRQSATSPAPLAVGVGTSKVDVLPLGVAELIHHGGLHVGAYRLVAIVRVLVDDLVRQLAHEHLVQNAPEGEGVDTVVEVSSIIRVVVGEQVLGAHVTRAAPNDLHVVEPHGHAEVAKLHALATVHEEVEALDI
mmetsp:Transcript_9886/g.22711  ORF Transcript_9886/g.22711 Transcript_9886/m.22711 type:complete len:235 (-) Transcript_9886:1335-2039(-)